MNSMQKLPCEQSSSSAHKGNGSEKSASMQERALSSSRLKQVHPPGQSVELSHVQAPWIHSPEGQTLPQPLQLAPSVLRSVQVPSQQASPAPQAQQSVADMQAPSQHC
jgi:hypothetical protein